MERHVYEDMNRLERSHWWFVARRRILAKVIGTYVPPGGAILDVGCGTGFVLDELKDRYEVHGLDAAEVAVDFCHQKGLPNVHLGILGETDFGRRDFDLVTFLDVIEHLDDDVAAMTSARALLKKDGLLLVTVPAYPFLWSAHDVVHHHRRRYTRSSLERAVRLAGFEPAYVSYFNTVLFPLIFSARMAGKLLGRDDASDAEHAPPSLVNTVLRAAFSAEKAVLPKVSMPFGVSLLCLARPARSS
ncbi:MAG: class I SAM-dependent methyltransferase [Polyangiales bacterium]